MTAALLLRLTGSDLDDVRMNYYVGLTEEVAPGTAMRRDIQGGTGSDANELWVWATSDLGRAISYPISRRTHRDGDGPIFVYEVELDSQTLQADRNDTWPGSVQARTGRFKQLAISFPSVKEAKNYSNTLRP